MLRAIVGRWVGEGATVDVVGTQPSYRSRTEAPLRPWREHVDGVSITRVRVLPERGSTLRRLVNVPLFTIAATRRVLGLTRGDVVMCSTAPPVLLSATVSLAARVRGARFIYHCMDIHPEIGSLSGEFRNPLVFRVLRAVDRATCRRAHCIVVLSRDMRRALLDRDTELSGKIVILNNFALPEYRDSLAPAGPALDGFQRGAALRLVFAGNIGRFQGLPEVVDAVLASNVDVELVVMGDGKVKDALREACAAHPNGRRVTFLPHGTLAEARTVMRSADAGVVSLAPGIARYAYPSKTMTYLGEGLPLLVVAEADSELSHTVEAERIGVAVEPGDIPGLERAMIRLARDSLNGNPGLRERARMFAEATYGKEHVLDQWAELLSEVLEDRIRTG